jgi:hypothetical protein
MYRSSLAVLVTALLASTALAQSQAIQRDPQALALLTQSVAAMGGTVPADSAATGTVTVTAGSTNENGTIQILTRGVDQSAENISTATIKRTAIYSQGLASEQTGSTATTSSLELAVSTQSLDFPLPFLARALNDPAFVVTYVGAGTLAGRAVNHIRVSQSFSNAKLQHLATLSQRDIWLDATSGLPAAASWIRKSARGAQYGIPVEIMFSDYRSVGAVLYPFHMNIFFNGTLWAAVAVQQVTFNTGLTDSNFPVQ